MSVFELSSHSCGLSVCLDLPTAIDGLGTPQLEEFILCLSDVQTTLLVETLQLELKRAASFHSNNLAPPGSTGTNLDLKQHVFNPQAANDWEKGPKMDSFDAYAVYAGDNAVSNSGSVVRSGTALATDGVRRTLASLLTRHGLTSAAVVVSKLLPKETGTESSQSRSLQTGYGDTKGAGAPPEGKPIPSYTRVDNADGSNSEELKSPEIPPHPPVVAASSYVGGRGRGRGFPRGGVRPHAALNPSNFFPSSRLPVLRPRPPFLADRIPPGSAPFSHDIPVPHPWGGIRNKFNPWNVPGNPPRVKPETRGDPGGMEDLWTSLFDVNIARKHCNDEEELRGVAILLDTTFTCFKRLKYKVDNIQQTADELKRRLDATTKELDRAEGEVIRNRLMPCERCQKLERQVSDQSKKLKQSDKRIKSIARILNLGNTQDCADQSQGNSKSVAKAYDLVSQMLLGDDDLENEDLSGEKPKNKRERMEHIAPKKIFTAQDKTPEKKRLKAEADVGVTLVPESFSSQLYECREANKIIIPETLGPCEVPDNVSPKRPLAEVPDANTNLEPAPILTTPEKQGAGSGAVKEKDSPVIGSTSKRIFPNSCKRNVTLEEVDNAASRKHHKTGNKTVVEVPLTAPPNKSGSPSILKTTGGQGTSKEKIDIEGAAIVQGHPSTSSPQGGKKADYWALKPMYELFDSPRKEKAKIEFNRGIRQTSTEASVKVASIGYNDDDDDALLQKNLEELLQQESEVIELADDDDEVVLESPNVLCRDALHACRLIKPQSSGHMKTSLKHRPVSDPDETLFIPPTSCKKPVVKNSKLSLRSKKQADSTDIDELLEEMARPRVAKTPRSDGDDMTCRQRKFNKQSNEERNSRVSQSDISDFDRIPEERPPSPPYVYQRDAVRGKKARSRLEGWACQDCKELYDGLNLTDAERKTLMNKCSKHRNKFPIRDNTQSGIWFHQTPPEKEQELPPTVGQ
uniref:DNA endonuclease RBBP8 n=1 Tax=Timema shepardi TaxID=629360 RepID=A0A7R9G548_TIMSH|nr:unnamed protein product [Timema shepardi]